jgi:hypothetical protein
MGRVAALPGKLGRVTTRGPAAVKPEVVGHRTDRLHSGPILGPRTGTKVAGIHRGGEPWGT